MRLGIICPSEIALRRFMPAVQKIDEIEYVGLGVCSIQERFGSLLPEKSIVDAVLQEEHRKASQFVKQYGGKIFEGYQTVVESDEIDAIYIPLPPALHFVWAKKAIENGKHVLVEKPSTVSADDTRQLVRLAEERGLSLHENYMFSFHKQLQEINEIIDSGEIGNVRLYRISFGFPRRAANDFRYSKALGGGALIDAGGYCIKYANLLLGDTARLSYAHMNYLEEFDVDMFGSAAMVNDRGMVAQISYGMDNNYKCDLEVWGSKGCLATGRVLTAPAGFTPQVTIRKGNNDEVRNLSEDDAFRKSIQHFILCVNDEKERGKNYDALVKQAEYVDEFRRLANLNI